MTALIGLRVGEEVLTAIHLIWYLFIDIRGFCYDVEEETSRFVMHSLSYACPWMYSRIEP